MSACAHAPQSGRPCPGSPAPSHLAGHRLPTKAARLPAGTHPPHRAQSTPRAVSRVKCATLRHTAGSSSPPAAHS
eukprot:6755092-Lingulodinium_polyedra.AAC.1